MSTQNKEQSGPKVSTETRLIKKYPNRRLYDTERCAYITLNDIKQYVIDHLPFRIIDAQTEADLTKATLMQIITEAESSPASFFTTELLQEMIRLYQENMQTIFKKSQNIDPFAAMQKLTQMQSDFWASLIKKDKT